jgi:Tol biopolymer transport system component
MRHGVIARLSLGSVLMSLLLLTAAAGPAGATFPGTNGRIAFTSNLHGNWQIYTMTGRGTNLQQVTHIPHSQDFNLFPSWSPDGTTLVFASSMSGDWDIYTVATDGTGLTQITHSPGADETIPSFSPDGTRIVFARVGDDGINHIWTMKADGTGQKRLTGAADGYEPQYTPDGQHILYDSSKGGLVAAVWIMNVEGSGKQRLTAPAREAGFTDVSPDGQHVLFSDHQNTNDPTSIFVMNIDGTGVTRLTDAGCCYHDGGGHYSPDGTKIVYYTDRNAIPSGCCYELWVMNADGSNQHEVTSNLTIGGCPETGNCTMPQWGPKP